MPPAPATLGIGSLTSPVGRPSEAIVSGIRVATDAGRHSPSPTLQMPVSTRSSSSAFPSIPSRGSVTVNEPFGFATVKTWRSDSAPTGPGSPIASISHFSGIRSFSFHPFGGSGVTVSVIVRLPSASSCGATRTGAERTGSAVGRARCRSSASAATNAISALSGAAVVESSTGSIEPSAGFTTTIR